MKIHELTESKDTYDTYTIMMSPEHEYDGKYIALTDLPPHVSTDKICDLLEKSLKPDDYELWVKNEYHSKWYWPVSREEWQNGGGDEMTEMLNWKEYIDDIMSYIGDTWGEDEMIDDFSDD